MRYLKAGSGPALIMVHGLLAYSFSWRFTIPVVAQHATVYAMDNLGAGLSPSPAGMDCGMRATAERLLQFVDALGIAEFDLLGTSHGGAVAMLAAALCAERHDPRLKRLILVAPVNPWSPHGKRLAPFVGTRAGSFLFRHTIARWRFLDYLWLRRLFEDGAKIPPIRSKAIAGPCGKIEPLSTLCALSAPGRQTWPSWSRRCLGFATIPRCSSGGRGIAPSTSAPLSGCGAISAQRT